MAGQAVLDSKGAQPPGPHSVPGCGPGMARWSSGKPIGQTFLQNLIQVEGRLGSGPHLTRAWSCCFLAMPSRPTQLPAAGSPASQLEQDPTNSPGLRGSWPQGRTWCWAAVDSHGQPWTAAAAGWPGCWGLTLGCAACLPFPPPPQVFIEHLLCVSQGSRVRGQSAFLPLGLTQPGAWGQVFFPKRTSVHRPWVHLLWGSPVPLGTAGWVSQEGACRVLCMEPSRGFFGNQGVPTPTPICFWASVPSSVLSPLCDPCPLALTSVFEPLMNENPKPRGGHGQEWLPPALIAAGRPVVKATCIYVPCCPLATPTDGLPSMGSQRAGPGHWTAGVPWWGTHL